MPRPDGLMGRRLLLRSGLVLGAGTGIAALTSCADRPAAGPAATRDRSAAPRPSAGGTAPAAGGSRVLLAFFSRPGEQYWNGGRRVVEVGNTAVIAGMISDLADVDVHRIEAVEPYPADYTPTVERSTRELQADARPAIAGALPRLDGYGTVLLGSPIWGVREPMILRTFVEGVGALAGTTVHPFVTYAVSGLGSAIADYTRLCPDATIGNPLAIRGEEARQGRGRVRSWLSGIGLV